MRKQKTLYLTTAAIIGFFKAFQTDGGNEVFDAQHFLAECLVDQCVDDAAVFLLHFLQAVAREGYLAVLRDGDLHLICELVSKV